MPVRKIRYDLQLLIMPTPSLLIVPARFKSAKLYSQIPISGAGDFTVTRATTATRVNASGLIESVASGIPRLDYFSSGGTVGCPALLVEPAATNGILNSADTTTSWSIVSGTLSSASIDVIGVSGNNLTVLVTGSTIAGAGRIVRGSNNVALASGSTYTISFLVKQTATHTIGGYYVVTTGAASGDIGASFNVSGSFSSGSIKDNASFTNRIRRVERWGTDVFRCSETFTMSASGTLTNFHLAPLVSTTSISNSAVGTQLGFAAPQIELGSVPTSFIPTTTGTVTRNADVISASGNVSGSIGQTEGSIYVEVDIKKLLGTTQRAFIDIGQTNNRLFLGYGNGITNQIRFLLQTSTGGLVDFQSAATTTGIIRIAVGYKNNDSAMYVNGVSVSPLSNGSFTATLTSLTQLSIGSSFNVGETHFLNDKINAVALYGTRLSNDALMLLSMQGNDAYLPQSIWNFYEDSRAGNTEVPTCLYTRHADLLDV